ncbi:DNA-binding response regulator [Actinosynnema sp. ALI-1.44]|uniref:response regulator n=1 Tax=Actinosynnema sp. ALI-1.44 TaxID=1933779 RepID=UPI00097C0657|nr:response regulator transcription factor [Actinosynnema sp. ALI-1.44]ONI76022.1 DNA-binding response regulator [Actinosynnema sp. ALI-1.44]
MSEPRRLRVVIAEDAVLLREGLIELLARFGHQVVAAVGDVPGLVAAVDDIKPDVVVTDVRMPPDYSDEGLRAVAQLRSRHPSLGVLVLTQYVATTYALELLETEARTSGGLGYLLKDRVGAVTEFIEAIERIADGHTVIDPEAVRSLLHSKRRKEALDRLTPRELEVLTLMALGKTNSAIAETLCVSQAAVAKNIGNIFTKLGLVDMNEHRRVLAVLTYLRK